MPVACWLLAVGCWLLAVGCWLLAVGLWMLAMVVLVHEEVLVVFDCGLGKLARQACFLHLPPIMRQAGTPPRAPKKIKTSYYGKCFIYIRDAVHWSNTVHHHHHPSLFFLGASLLGHAPAIQYTVRVVLYVHHQYYRPRSTVPLQ